MGRLVARWEDPIQQDCTARTASSTCWRDLAQDKERWVSLEDAFLRTHLTAARHTIRVSRGRWMIGDSLEATAFA